MITKISIENFKCFGERVEIPIRPLTLLFGANSAGKSTIIQALLYAREILERQNLDADKTVSSGSFVDLGGYKTFVHDHDISRKVQLRFEFNVSEDDFPDYISDDEDMAMFEVRGDEDAYRLGNIYYQFDSVGDAWVELGLTYNRKDQRPFLSSISIGINGERIAEIEYQYGRKEAYVKNINASHRIFDMYAEKEGRDAIGFNLAKAAYARCGEKEPEEPLDKAAIPFATEDHRGALPELGKILNLPTLLPETAPGLFTDDSSDESALENQRKWDDRRICGKVLAALLTQSALSKN